jgi:hypothetical protein
MRGSRRRRRLSRRFGRGTALDDLVEFAAVEPDAAALRAVIDLDTLPVAHMESHLAHGAHHSGNGFGGSHHRLLIVVDRA